MKAKARCCILCGGSAMSMSEDGATRLTVFDVE